MSPLLAAYLAQAREAEACADLGAGIAAYEAALREAPGIAELHFNRANLLRRAGRTAPALAGYKQAIALKPGWAAPRLNRGALLADGGKHDAAVQEFRQATAIAPDDPQGWNNLGNALCAIGRAADAADALRHAVTLAPDAAVAWFNLGNALTAAGAAGAAVSAFSEALRLDPHCAGAAVNLSARLRELGETEGALRAAELAVHVAADLAEAHLALGCVRVDLGDFDGAGTALRRALACNPRLSGVYANLGLVQSAQGAFDDALHSYDAALRLAPRDAQAQFGRATALLATGDYRRGWAEFGCRRRMPGTQDRQFRKPAWRGARADGRAILLHAEQGFGDTLQFLRFAPRVAAQSGARVILEVPAPLARLCTRLEGIAHVIARGAALPSFALHCSLLDLGAVFAPSLDALAPAAPYLTADPDLIAAHRLASCAGLRVGVVWAGQSRPDHPHAFAMDRRRSLRLADLMPLRRPGWHFVSLQAGAPAAQLDGVDDIENPMPGVQDFADTAAIIAQLDLVISVDTAVAHLAAALGKPVWLLCRADACWRWMRGRDDSPWYPTLRIFRQARAGDWGSALAAAKDAVLF